jgi:hypothetical protein
MTKWIRFQKGARTGFGTLEGDAIAVHTGDLFAAAEPRASSFAGVQKPAQILTCVDAVQIGMKRTATEGRRLARHAEYVTGAARVRRARVNPDRAAEP